MTRLSVLGNEGTEFQEELEGRMKNCTGRYSSISEREREEITKYFIEHSRLNLKTDAGSN